jgi:hypothetical protein
MVAPQSILYLVLLAATLVATALGLLIVFQAYRGYRRNNSRRMLYLAAGLGLIIVAPFALSLVFTLLVPGDELLMSYALPLGSRLLEISGLGLIIYSLYRV